MLNGVVKRISGLLRLLVILAFALAGSQLSAFMDAYGQNLAGRLAEAEQDVAGIIDRARAADLPLYAYLEKFRTTDDPVFVREGNALQAKIDHAAFLSDDLGALDRASVALKPFVFFGRLDGAIALSAWRRFDPAIPLDGAGLIYAGFGLLAGLILTELATAAVRSAGRPIQRGVQPALR